MSISFAKTHPQEPDFDLDRESLDPNTCYILVWTGFDKLIIEDAATRTERTINFPPFSYTQKIVINPEHEQYLILMLHAKRIRNYLSFCFFEQIPIYYKFIGKNLLMPSMFRADIPFLPMAHTYTQENVDKQFLATYDYVKNLLCEIPTDSFDDHIINLFGAFFWTEESLDRFMYAWRLIEMISNKTLNSFTKEDFGEFGRYIEQKDLTKFVKRMHITDKIKVALQKKVPHVKLDYLEKAYEIRNEIFHSAISTELYATSRPEMEWVVATAQELVKTIQPTVFTGIQMRK